MSPGTAPLDWPQRLATLWAGSIPLAAAMGVEVSSLDERHLELRAPLAANRNHMGSAFGGSLQGLATLAGWGVTLIATGDPDAHHVVIRDAQMRFIAPVSGDLVADAVRPSPGAVAAFLGALDNRGRARLTVPVTIPGPGGTAAARFIGEYVAFAAGARGAPESS